MTTNIISYKLTCNDILCRKNEVFLQFFMFFTSKKIKRRSFSELFFASNFFMAQLLLRKVYIFELYLKFCVFWYPISPYCEKKIFDPYIVHDPKGRAQPARVQLMKKIFFTVFPTISMDTTLLHLIIIGNVKKADNWPTLIYSRPGQSERDSCCSRQCWCWAKNKRMFRLSDTWFIFNLHTYFSFYIKHTFITYQNV